MTSPSAMSCPCEPACGFICSPRRVTVNNLLTKPYGKITEKVSVEQLGIKTRWWDWDCTGCQVRSHPPQKSLPYSTTDMCWMSSTTHRSVNCKRHYFSDRSRSRFMRRGFQTHIWGKTDQQFSPDISANDKIWNDLNWQKSTASWTLYDNLYSIPKFWKIKMEKINFRLGQFFWFSGVFLNLVRQIEF